MLNFYCTADKIGLNSGGGIVTRNELEALKSLGDVTAIGSDELDSSRVGYSREPFLIDYMAEEQALELLKTNVFTFSHFYAGTFTKTIRAFKRSHVKVSYTVDAHDRRESIAEFGNLGMTYPYIHMSDDKLFNLYVQGYREADLVICPTKKGAEIMKGFGCERVEIVPHGVELPESVKPYNSRFDVLYLGQVGPDKGLIYLIKAWAKLNLKDACLILAGNGTTDLFDWVRIFGKGNIQILGWVPNKSDVFNSCSVYVQPSVTEGFGIEILEAMAHGRVVISSSGAGACEIIEEGVDGFVVPIRNPDAIAERIFWCYQNKDKLPEMGLAGRKKAMNYTWDKIRQKYVDTWSGV